MASEASRKKAEKLCHACRATKRIYRYAASQFHACEEIAAALDAARAEGVAEGEKRAAATIRENVMTAKQAAERERWECYHEALDTIDDMIEQSSYKAMEGMRWVVSRISARGPMRGPEEEE